MGATKNHTVLRIGSGRPAKYRGIFAVLVCLILALGLRTLPAQNVTLAWSSSPDASGYIVYYSSDGITFYPILNVGNQTACTVTNVQQGYFEVVAYNSAQVESLPSNRIEYNIPNSSQTLTNTLLVNPSGAGTVSGGGPYAAGSSVTVMAVANAGYTFANWTENGIVLSPFSSYSFTLITNHTLVANFTVNPSAYTVATQSSPTDAGSVTGAGDYTPNTAQTVTATANAGYTFNNWTEDGIILSTAPNFSFILTGDLDLVANFTANPVFYTVTTQGSPDNAGSVTDGGSYLSGTSLLVTAGANPGYTFGSWTQDGIVQSTSPDYGFTVTSNLNLVANFIATAGTFTVAAQGNPANAGSVTGTGTYSAATVLTLTATPNAGYTFSSWTENGNVQTTSPDYSFTLTGNRNLMANFSANSGSYMITSSAGTNGTVTPNGSQTLPAGNSITFTATPASNYQVAQWLVNGAAAQTGGATYNLQNVTSNLAVTVTFSAESGAGASGTAPTSTPILVVTNFTLLTSGSGVLLPSHNINSFRPGKTYTLTASPAKGSVFANWASNGVVVGTVPKYTFTVESNLLLQAYFVANPFTPVVGTYRGLFWVSTNVAEESSGSLVATVTSTGAFSAKLALAGRNYSFSKALSATGAAAKSIARPGLNPLDVQLQLGLTNGLLTGAIGDGTWTAALSALPAAYSKTNHAPQAGQYTLLIPGNSSASAQPCGNGFGSVTVTAAGNVTFGGMLGDATTATGTTVLSRQGQWPLYISLYGGKGSMLGWLAFTNSGISGQTAWFKLPQATAKLYPNGITQSAEVTGSAYNYASGLPILDFIDGRLLLTNGDLPQNITNQIVLNPAAPITSQSTNDQTAWKLEFKPSTGMFKGSVLNPETGASLSINGVVLQNQDFGAGLFIGTTETGSVTLSPAR
jgi:hypothetical protein